MTGPGGTPPEPGHEGTPPDPDNPWSGWINPEPAAPEPAAESATLDPAEPEPAGPATGDDPVAADHPLPDIDGAEPGDREPPRRWYRHPWRIAALVFVVVGLVVVVGGGLWLRSEASPSGPAGPQVIVTVPSGSGTSQLASSLQSKGVIGSSLAYRIWSRFHGGPTVLTGSYAFRKNSSFSAVEAVITAGPDVFSLDVPPGFTVREVAQRVGEFPGHSQATFATAATNGSVPSPWQPAGSTNLDGLLGTGTYLVVPGETDHQLLTEMVDRFNATAAKLGLVAGSARLGLSPYQVITMASIVEKEGVISKNLGPVARVVLNRLAQGLPLQMDSTVLYSEHRDGGTVTSQDLQLDTPYNTYLHAGLTPTPICFPSPAALAAALDPPRGSWLYFVLVAQDGTEAFANTYAEQLANEALAKQRGLP